MSKFGVPAFLCAGLVACALSTSARASVVYDLTLTDASNATYDGTGTITLGSAPSPTMQSNYTSAAVTFQVDGQLFSGNATSVQFLDGNFRNATFSETIGNTPMQFTLDTTGGYAFYADGQQEAAGTITSSLATTPLPAALPLFAGGFGMVGFLARRRKRNAANA